MTNKPHRPNCAECKNLESGGWCTALLKSVSGSRHTRKCEHFVFGRHNPKPVRKGRKQHPGLVQCVSCIDFIPWGECGLGQDEDLPFLSHSYLCRLEPRIWRRCEDYIQSDIKVRCVDCIHLHGDYCHIGEYPVTGSDKEISCQFFH
jgi:hypothetical protein